MLCSQTVAPTTLALLKRLCREPLLEAFALGGGTGIALQKGHRISIDLDFFTNQPFTNSVIYKCITGLQAKAELIFEQNQTMMFIIDNVKVDFILYPFAWLHPFVLADDCRFIHPEDIIPMKLQAVSNRFAKKDFYDLEALLADYTLAEMLGIFERKFPDIDTGFLIHSLTHFDVADTEESPVLLPSSKSWQQVKENLQNAVKTYTLGFL
ncbi:MAG TPA: nucleotidyl transferase AbiEii/AbiGii toxin family protein [Chitinophagaceae bacterium]|nr:nucleotidyl transferase AbiEii/AbiGii toxin family protein [Chitinophagaceae bacterium]